MTLDLKFSQTFSIGFICLVLIFRLYNKTKQSTMRYNHKHSTQETEVEEL